MSEIYRRSSIGLSLLESLEEMKDIPDQLKQDILNQFDLSMKEALENLVQNRVTFTGSISSLRNVMEVYMIGAKDLKISLNQSKTLDVNLCKFVLVKEDKEE